jgi:lysine-specific demethylase 8
LPKTVDRSAAPISRQLLLELAVAQRPLIFTGVFDGQPVRRITTITDLPAHWADLRVLPREPAERVNYPGKTLAETTVSRFLTERSAGFVHDEIPSPSVNSSIVLPGALNYGSMDASPYKSSFYMGNPGAFTHLHFDANCRHNFHYQLIGKKRFFLFPEHRSKYLAPQQQSSRIFLERLSAVERTHFTDYAGGYACVLEPGDSLYMPPLMWHYVEYEQPGISLSYRFAWSRHILNLQRAFGGFHFTVEFQHLAAGLLDDENVAPAYQDAYQQILNAVGHRYEFSRVQQKLEQLCAQICPEKVECLYANWQDNSLAIDQSSC